jgi:hypothetical protein
LRFGFGEATRLELLALALEMKLDLVGQVSVDTP